MTGDEDWNRVKKVVSDLGEHFDTVQIFVTRHDGEGTERIIMGAGNWFARYGVVRTWADRMDECERQKERG